MKRKLLVILTFCVFSIAIFNSLSQKNAGNICVNQIGVTAYAYGKTTNNTWLEWGGGIVTAIGSGVTGTGMLGVMGLVALSNPFGWVVAGIVIGT